MTNAELAEAKQIAKMMEQWITGRSGSRSYAVYFKPFGIDDSRIVGRLDERYIIGGLDNIEGCFTVVAQADSLLESSDNVSAIRVIRDVPPTTLEIATAREALTEMIEPAKEMVWNSSRTILLSQVPW
jgi:hypothetical protein